MKYLNYILTILLLLAIPDAALAQVNSITPVENTLQGIVNILTGTIGTSIAIIGLAVVGILFIMGRISMMQSAMVVGGIAILFGAPVIVAELQGGL